MSYFSIDNSVFKGELKAKKCVCVCVRVREIVFFINIIAILINKLKKYDKRKEEKNIFKIELFQKYMCAIFLLIEIIIRDKCLNAA